MRKKILFVYHVSSIGGGSFCLLNILKNLDRDRIEPCVLLCKHGPLVEEIRALNIQVLLLNSMRPVPYNKACVTLNSILNACFMARSFKRFGEILDDVNPDSIYCNTMMLYPYLKVGKMHGCKTFIHIREHWPEGEHRWQRNMAFKHIAKYADRIIGINHYSASMVEPYGRKATIVYDWIDLSSRYEKYPLNEVFNEDMTNKKVFLYLGGMQEIKGAWEVLTAFTEYLKDDNYRLLALGININYRSDGLKGLVKKILTFIGRKPYSERVIETAKSDNRIKCIPSVYNIKHIYEQTYCVLSYFTIPHANLALAESIISNTLTVAARTEESIEYSDNENLAVLFKIGDLHDFREKIESIQVVHDTVLDKIKVDSWKLKELFAPDINIKRLNGLLMDL